MLGDLFFTKYSCTRGADGCLCCQPFALAPYHILTEPDYVPSLGLWASTMPAEWAAGHKLSTPATADWTRMGPSPKESDQILFCAKSGFKLSLIKTTLLLFHLSILPGFPSRERKLKTREVK